MDLNEKFPFSKNDQELAFQWTEQEWKYAEDGVSCSNIESLTKQVFFLFFFLKEWNFWHKPVSYSTKKWDEKWGWIYSFLNIYFKWVFQFLHEIKN